MFKRRNVGSGRGDYSITANNIVDHPESQSVVPKFGPDATSVVIRNSEYIRDIYVQVSDEIPFVNQTISLNPGLPEAFPWLSQIACNYEEYELVQCIYTFKTGITSSSVAMLSSTAQQGEIIIASNTNPSAKPFADKETMQMYEGVASCPISGSLIHGVECDPSKNAGTSGRKYIRTGGLSLGTDIKEYDHALLNIAISQPNQVFLGQAVGQLWVSYTVVLKKPKLGSLNGNSLPTDKFVYMTPDGNSLASVQNRPFPMSMLWKCPMNSLGCKLYSVYDPVNTTTSTILVFLPSQNPTTNVKSSSLLALRNISPNSVALFKPIHFN